MNKNITVLGCGRWGSFHAWYANHIGHAVTLWGRNGSKNLEELINTRKNEYLTLPKEIELTSDLAPALNKAEIIIISIHAQALRSFLAELKEIAGTAGIAIKDKKLILCMKGIEISTGSTLSKVAKEELGKEAKVAVWLGPGHVQDFTKGIPNCMVIAGEDKKLVKELVDSLASPLIRFYYGEDLLGTELGAAAKNVVGLAAGMLDGLNYGSLKGALMARGAKEMSRLVIAMGGSGDTVYGLSHLGDYEATLFSKHSNNRAYGEAIIKGTAKDFSKIAEGVYTAKALMNIADKLGVDLPISRAVHAIVSKGKDPKEELLQLFMRATKSERE